jgi:drug/metabolite transporter (DMT)-like permease
MRIIASAIVVLAGAMCFGLGAATPDYVRRDVWTVGGILLFAGGVCFAIEFYRTWTRKD